MDRDLVYKALLILFVVVLLVGLVYGLKKLYDRTTATAKYTGDPDVELPDDYEDDDEDDDDDGAVVEEERPIDAIVVDKHDPNDVQVFSDRGIEVNESEYKRDNNSEDEGATLGDSVTDITRTDSDLRYSPNPWIASE